MSGKNGLINVFIAITKNFGKIDIFCLSDALKPPLEPFLGKIPVFAENMKYRSKNRVSDVNKVTFGVFDEFSTYTSDGVYRK